MGICTNLCVNRNVNQSLDRSDQYLMDEIKYCILNGGYDNLELALKHNIKLQERDDFIFFLLESCFFLDKYDFQEILEIIEESNQEINLDWNLKSPSQKLRFQIKKMTFEESEERNLVWINGKESQMYLTRDEIRHMAFDGDYYFQHDVTFKEGANLTVAAYIIYLRNIARKYHDFNNDDPNTLDALDYLDKYIQKERKKLDVTRIIPINPLPIAPSAPPMKLNMSQNKNKETTGKTCSICGIKEIKVIYNCSHVTNCVKCSRKITHCPICRTNITSRKKVHIASFD